MTTRAVKFTETVRLGRQTYVAGDVKTLPKAEADQAINAGWGEDAETGETGERVPGARGALDVNKASQASE